MVRQLLTESVMLAFAGGAAGLIIAHWLTQWLHSLLPDRYLFMSFNLNVGLDWRVFGFALGVTTATGVVFGLVPALHASRPDLVTTLKGSGSSVLGGRSLGLRGALVVTEVALALVLLVASGLVVRTLQNVVAIDTGYESSHVLTARLDLAKQSYDETRGRVFQRQLINRLLARPEVETAAFAVTLPLNDSRWENPIRRDGDATRVQTFQRRLRGLFRHDEHPLLAGRQFSERDDDRSPKSRSSTRLWRDSCGRMDRLGTTTAFKGQTIEVIGVARDIKAEPP